MARPQLENGFMRICHEVTVALISCGLTKVELSLVLYALRMIWGYQGRKSAEVTAAQFAHYTRTDIRYVKRALKSLHTMNILRKKIASGGRLATTWEFNKNYDNWKTPKKPLKEPTVVKSTTVEEPTVVKSTMVKSTTPTVAKSATVNSGRICHPTKKVKKEKEKNLSPTPFLESDEEKKTKLTSKQIKEKLETEFAEKIIHAFNSNPHLSNVKDGPTKIRKDCIRMIRERLKEGYSPKELYGHMIKYSGKVRAHKYYTKLMGETPDHNSRYWCPSVKWNPSMLFGPQRFADYFSTWSTEELITKDELTKLKVRVIYGDAIS